MPERPIPSGLVLVMDLINTLDIEKGEDALATPGGREKLRRAHGLTELAGLPAEAVPELQRLREVLRAACRLHDGPSDPGRRPAAARGAQVASVAVAPAPMTLAPLPASVVLHLSPTGDATLLPAPGLTAVETLTARVAAAVAAADADGTWRRLKVCEADTCQWAYYDHSPARRRRWCSMQVCGARAKMRTYRASRSGRDTDRAAGGAPGGLGTGSR
ncbi:CGNR zinc finger domain-containing protein [Streptomyces sp. 4N509B]|uniref:CGNR zinc finger domain-containing protein n=1 Tax=Streptomyces sp. 4N509B TaxID=3457413 RepID=UPI003FD3B4B0